MFRLRGILLPILACCLFLCVSNGAQAQQKLAIFNLRPTNMDAMGYNGDILYALISSLEGEKAIEVMPRREMEEILFHAGIVQADDPELVREAGKILGIKYVLFGQVTKKGEKIKTLLKLMDVDENRIIRSWSPTYVGRDAIISEGPEVIAELSDTIRDPGQAASSTSAASKQTQLTLENFQARSEGNTVVLTWKSDAASTATSFHIYRAQSADGPYQFNGKTEQNTFRDSTVKKGRSYHYRIGIIDTAGKETKIDRTASVSSVGEKVPHPPLILNIGGHVRRVAIKFLPSLLNEQEKFKIKTYKVYSRKGSSGDWKVAAKIDATELSKSELAFFTEDTEGIEDGQTYNYAVSSIDRKKRESPMSDPIEVKTIRRPTLTVDSQNLLRKIILAWDTINNTSGYYLYRKAGEEDWEQAGNISDPSVFRFEDEQGLEDGRNYIYRLTAYDEKGETGPSNEVPAQTKKIPVPPKRLQVESGLVKSVQLSWPPIDDPDVGGYLIFRGTNGKDFKRVDKVKGYQTNTYLDDGSAFNSLDDGQEYHYMIAGFNLFGAEGEYTRPAMAKTKPRPIPVKGLSVNASGKQIEIQWSANPEPDVEVYILSRDRNNGFWSKLTELGAGKTAYVDKDLKAEVSYRYRVVVVDKDGLKSDPVESGIVLSPIVKPKK